MASQEGPKHEEYRRRYGLRFVDPEREVVDCSEPVLLYQIGCFPGEDRGLWECCRQYDPGFKRDSSLGFILRNEYPERYFMSVSRPNKGSVRDAGFDVNFLCLSESANTNQEARDQFVDTTKIGLLEPSDYDCIIMGIMIRPFLDRLI